ncbi:transcriptional regulator [Alkalihalobacillus sp. MEB130]|uniref:transcriptional regulator n=1 Tax=Alkalihalobacillus sp. MEB130 TaxID=2976704 RepID=UPI0028DF5298|nr:transcriptional regulator [Alkalihalobacillus sp. MEB130]MDT8858767.1 transcriptional regulator [Alkalihalobacillus sp. MEB130]
MTSFELYVILPLVALLLLVQSTLLFIDAKKKGSFPWFWGIWGLIQFPLPTVFYLLFVIWPRKRKQKQLEKER